MAKNSQNQENSVSGNLISVNFTSDKKYAPRMDGHSKVEINITQSEDGVFHWVAYRFGNVIKGNISPNTINTLIELEVLPPRNVGDWEDALKLYINRALNEWTRKENKNWDDSINV